MNYKLLSLWVVSGLIVIGTISGLKFSQKATINIQLETNHKQRFQIFWAEAVDKNRLPSFSEDDSVIFVISPKKHQYQVKLTSFGEIGFLRLDPAKRPAKIIINKISLSQPGYFDRALTKAELYNIVEGNLLFINDSGQNMLMDTLSSDGQFLFAVDPDFSVIKYCSDMYDLGSGIYKTIQARFELLGITFFPTLLWLCDIALVVLISSLILLLLRVDYKQTGLFLSLVLLMTTATIVLSTTIIGGLSMIHFSTFLLFHCVIFSVLFCISIVRRQKNEPYPNSIVELYREFIVEFRKKLFDINSLSEKFFIVLLLTILAGLFVLYLVPAIFTLPLNYDSNNYRLTRVGYWLQQGSILHYPTLDKRQLFMAVNGELVMLWIISFFKHGFPLVHLVQILGGLLASVSTYSLSRIIGYSRIWSLVSVVFFLGIPVAASQMPTSQTDLFTAGCLITGLFFLFRAMRFGKISDFSFMGMGIGLAVGTKGTVFFWGPGLVFIFLGLWLIYRTNFRNVLKGCALTVCLIVLCGGFNYIQNFVKFDNALAPSSEIEGNVFLHKKTITKKEDFTKKKGTLLKGEALLWQVFEPSSNLKILHPVTNSIAAFLEKDIRTKSKNLKSYFVNRYKLATLWVRAARYSEDYASFGLVPFFLFLIGGCLSVYHGLVRRDKKGRVLLVLFISVLCYFLFYPYVRAWSVHQYRYAVLLTPFISIIAIYCFEGIQWAVWKTMVLPVLLYQLIISWMFATQGLNHGWKPMLKLGTYPNNYVYYWQDTESLIKQLAGNAKRVGLYVGKGPWIAQLFDRRTFNQVEYIVGEPSPLVIDKQFLKKKMYDAVILQNPNNVEVGEGMNVIFSNQKRLYGVQAATKEDKQKPWLLGGDIYGDGWTKPAGQFRIGNWPDGSLIVKLRNPTDSPRLVNIESSVENHSITLEAQQHNYQDIAIMVNDHDTIKWSITPVFKPWKHGSDTDTRPLGTLIHLPDLY